MLLKRIVPWLLLLSSAHAVADECRAPSRGGNGELRFEFPQTIASFAKAEERRSENPAYGSAARYWSGGAALEITARRTPASAAARDVDSFAFQERFEALKHSLVSDAQFDRAALQSERTRKTGAGGLPVREAIYLLRNGPSQRMGFIYLAVAHEHFIEANMMLEEPKFGDAMPITDAVLAGIDAIFCGTAGGVSGNAGATTSNSAQAGDALKAARGLLNAASSFEALQFIEPVINFVRNEPAIVSVYMDQAFFQPSGDQRADQFLLAYYLAGAIVHDVENPQARFDRLADVPASLRALIRGYRTYTVENAYFVHPFVEQLIRIEDSSGLESWVNRGAQ